jgi:hypothetical protein
MATETHKTCDVYKARRRVNRYKLSVALVADDDNMGGVDESVIPSTWTKDLGPRAVNRTLAAIQRVLGDPDPDETTATLAT